LPAELTAKPTKNGTTQRASANKNSSP